MSPHHPVHVTLRACRGLPSLRSHGVFKVVRSALAAGKQRAGFRLVHFSVQSNHLHLLTEADDRRCLSRGVQGVCVRIARAVNRQLHRRGDVFADRYHDRSLKTPRTVHFALRYILLNVHKHDVHKHDARKHGASKLDAGKDTARKHERAAVPTGFVDPCSSAPWFNGFARPAALVFGAQRARAEWAQESAEPPIAEARCWLLRIGLRRVRGVRAFDIDEAPSSA